MGKISEACYEAERTRSDRVAELAIKILADGDYRACEKDSQCSKERPCRMHRVAQDVSAIIDLLEVKPDGRTAPARPSSPNAIALPYEWRVTGAAEIMYEGNDPLGEIVRTLEGWVAIYFNHTMNEARWDRSRPMAKADARDSLELAALAGMRL